jgi:hypothetical protein
MINESSSSEEDEPMPSTSKYGIPPDNEFENRLIKENNDLIDVQTKLSDDYLETLSEIAMDEADSIDDIIHEIEDDIKLIRNVLYIRSI